MEDTSLLELSRVQKAALNNAEWVRAFTAAHHRRSSFETIAWVCRMETPSLTPNLITLGGPEHSPDHQRLAQSLIEASIPGQWAIKDSFACLELQIYGFQKLLKGQWLWKEPALDEELLEGMLWDRVGTDESLLEFDTAWAESEPERPAKRHFTEDLLSAPDIHVHLMRKEGKAVAGCVVNTHAGVIGVSNMFLPQSGDCVAWRKSLVNSVHHTYPTLPLICWEDDKHLQDMISIGFAPIGPMCIWERL